MTNYTKTVTPASYAPLIFRQLANPKKWAILQYLGKAKIGTVSIVTYRCQLGQSVCSRYLRDLAAAGLVTKVRIGSVRFYEINQRAWAAVGRCLKTIDGGPAPSPAVSCA